MQQLWQSFILVVHKKNINCLFCKAACHDS